MKMTKRKPRRLLLPELKSVRLQRRLQSNLRCPYLTAFAAYRWQERLTKNPYEVYWGQGDCLSEEDYALLIDGGQEGLYELEGKFYDIAQGDSYEHFKQQRVEMLSSAGVADFSVPYLTELCEEYEVDTFDEAVEAFHGTSKKMSEMDSSLRDFFMDCEEILMDIDELLESSKSKMAVMEINLDDYLDPAMFGLEGFPDATLRLESEEILASELAGFCDTLNEGKGYFEAKLLNLEVGWEKSSVVYADVDITIRIPSKIATIEFEDYQSFDREVATKETEFMKFVKRLGIEDRQSFGRDADMFDVVSGPMPEEEVVIKETEFVKFAKRLGSDLPMPEGYDPDTPIPAHIVAKNAHNDTFALLRYDAKEHEALYLLKDQWVEGYFDGETLATLMSLQENCYVFREANGTCVTLEGALVPAE